MTAVRKAKRFVLGAVFGLLLFGAGAALAAYLLSVSGNGIVNTYAMPDVVFVSADLTSVSESTCVATKLSATTWNLSMTDAKPGSTCGASLVFTNNGNVTAYIGPGTYTAPAGITVAANAMQSLAPGETNGYAFVVTNASWPVGPNANLTFSLGIDDTP